jgi:hypothetical protein
MLLRVNSIPEDGYYYYPKHVREIIIYTLTNVCVISWKYIIGMYEVYLTF